MGSSYSYSKYMSVDDIIKVPRKKRSQRLCLRVFDNALREHKWKSVNSMIDNLSQFLQARFIHAVSNNRYRSLLHVNAPRATYEDQYYQTLFLRLIQAGYEYEAIKLRHLAGIPLSDCFSQISFSVDSVFPDRESLEDVFRKNGIDLREAPYYCHSRSQDRSDDINYSRGCLKSIFAVAVNTESLDLVKDLLDGVTKEDLRGDRENVVRNLFRLADKLHHKGKFAECLEFERMALDIIKMFDEENLGFKVFTEACFYGMSNVATYIIDHCYLPRDIINHENPQESILMYCINRGLSDVFGKIIIRFYHGVEVKSDNYLAWVGKQIRDKPHFSLVFNLHV